MPNRRSGYSPLPELSEEEQGAFDAVQAVFLAFKAYRDTMPLQYAITFMEIARNEGKMVQDYSQALGVSQSVMSRHLQDLGDLSRSYEEGFGLIQTSVDPLNRRAYRVTLTDKGRAFARQIYATMRKVVRDVVREKEENGA